MYLSDLKEQYFQYLSSMSIKVFSMGTIGGGGKDTIITTIINRCHQSTMPPLAPSAQSHRHNY
jgi:hypothetical protein